MLLLWLIALTVGLIVFSTPSFDNSEFSNGVSYEKWKSLVNDDTKPLLNRCIAGLYALAQHIN